MLGGLTDTLGWSRSGPPTTLSEAIDRMNTAVHAVSSLTPADIHQLIVMMIFDGVRPRPDGAPMPAPAITEGELSRAVRSAARGGG